ncbi:MAG: NAD(+) synthase [Patescibacteria group bacterium]
MSKTLFKKKTDFRTEDASGVLRVAAITPTLKVADIDYNVKQILSSAQKAATAGARLVVFPELSITGYTLGDLFQQRILLDGAKFALLEIQKASRNIKSVLLVGLPLAHEGKLFNVAAIIYQGKIFGLVPKSYIPGYKEFYEERWFSAGRDAISREVRVGNNDAPFGADLLFRFPKLPGVILGVEICEDLWVPIPPSSFQAINGATIIANLSASNDLVGKADYRKSLVTQQSARNICGYIYAACGVQESTTDLVFGGHSMIAENGGLIAEAKRFSRNGETIIADLDIDHLLLDRERTTSFGESKHESSKNNFRFIDIPLAASTLAANELKRFIDPHPFVPSNPAERDKRAEEIFSIQANGLAKRLEHSGMKKLIIGLSGGLDSTLAILVAMRTGQLLGLPAKNVHAFTMPGFATTKRTKSNAVKLAKKLGANLEEIDITEGCLRQMKDISHDGKTQDLTFQNVQARYRTMILMNKANQLRGLVVGTGDLSEIALGWCTYTGDHISHYNVNGGIPKTLVKYLVQWVSERPDFVHAKSILKDILETPISPELIRSGKKEITQKTEDLIGPYELHDFFLYHFVRWGSSPSKIMFLAKLAFSKKYSEKTIQQWLKVFITRFFQNQWKRSVMPDGPKVGSVVLSPRGDWRMPSDAEAKLWLKNL